MDQKKARKRGPKKPENLVNRPEEVGQKTPKRPENLSEKGQNN